jgi:hypothetical protein
MPEMRRRICSQRILGSDVANHAERASREGETTPRGGENKMSKVLFNLVISSHRIRCNCRWDVEHGYGYAKKRPRPSKKRAIDNLTATFTSNHRFSNSCRSRRTQEPTASSD